jgi:polysaccharide export outer membrane protein
MSILRLSSFAKGVLILSLMSVAACSDKRGGIVPYDIALAQPDAPAPVTGADDRLAPLDTVMINVFRVPDLSRDYTIDLSGNLSMPLIGNVKAVGLTTDQLSAAIKASLGAKYLQDPYVTVALKESQRRTVTVEGSVKSPGIYATSGPITLLQAVATAKGLDQDANPHRVVIFRTIDGKRMAAAFDLQSIRRSEAKDPDVFPGDIVVVDGSSVSSTRREVLQSIPVLSIFATVL